jgi:glycosyltransferase involved in cell wall biosynthesis
MAGVIAVKVLHVNDFGSRQGGTEAYIAEVAAALQMAGHESHLVYFKGDNAEQMLPSTHITLPAWPASIEATAREIDHVIEQFRPDVAYLHVTWHPALVEWLAQRLPTVAFVHAPYVACPGSAKYLRRSDQVCEHRAGPICLWNGQMQRCCWGRNPLKHLRALQLMQAFTHAYQHVPAILVGTNFMRDLLTLNGFPAGHIDLLSPVLLPDTATPMPVSTAATVLFAGRLVPEKGVQDLIQALASVTVDWKMIVAGEGPDRGAAQALADRLGVTHRIEFAGWLNEVQMDEAYRQSACVAYPSRWPEPFGRVGPEAFVRGRPVVAYATGGIPTWLQDGVNGYLVPPGDVRSFGQRLQQVLSDAALQKQLGKQAHHYALAEWNSAAHVEKLVSVFKSAV